MDAVTRAREQNRKERTDRMYREVRATNPDLYERAVMIASVTPGLTLEARAELERQCVGLVADALLL